MPALAAINTGGGDEGMDGGSPSEFQGAPPATMMYPDGDGMGADASGGEYEVRESIDVVYLKLKAKNVLPRKRETLNREYAQLIAKMFRDNEMFSSSEDETKVIGAIPSIDSRARWFDFVVQLTLTKPITMKDEEIE